MAAVVAAVAVDKVAAVAAAVAAAAVAVADRVAGADDSVTTGPAEVRMPAPMMNASVRIAMHECRTSAAYRVIPYRARNVVNRWLPPEVGTNEMRIAIASGKGGTGKTILATNLAVFLARTGHTVSYIDCDVEEPNGRVFLYPRVEQTIPVTVPVPAVDLGRCTFCGECADFCEFNALAVLKDNVLFFEGLCHGCGGCSLVCPEQAIAERKRTIGTITVGSGHGVRFVEGRLDVGEAQAPPVIAKVKQQAAGSSTSIIDAPPGTSCPVIESIADSDFVILVTEPTPFGLHDLRLAVGMLGCLHLPYGVVINRDGTGREIIEQFCNRHGVEILARIPFDRRIAEQYAQGRLLIDCSLDFEPILTDLFESITRRVAA